MGFCSGVFLLSVVGVGAWECAFARWSLVTWMLLVLGTVFEAHRPMGASEQVLPEFVAGRDTSGSCLFHSCLHLSICPALQQPSTQEALTFPKASALIPYALWTPLSRSHLGRHIPGGTKEAKRNRLTNRAPVRYNQC